MKKFVGWYELQEEYRAMLGDYIELYELRDSGCWSVDGRHDYEPDAFAVLRRHATLTYDIIMPKLASLMSKGIRVAIFPRGMKTLDVVFYRRDRKKRAGVV